MAKVRETFREKFTEHRMGQSGVVSFEWEVFRQCIRWHARPLVWLLLRIDKNFFKEDLEFISEAGYATSRDELIGEINRFYGRNLRDRNRLRKAFALRVSGKKVLRLWDDSISDH